MKHVITKISKLDPCHDYNYVVHVQAKNVDFNTRFYWCYILSKLFGGSEMQTMENEIIYFCGAKKSL